MVTLLDLRYINSGIVSQFVTFRPVSDILFLYGSQIWNSPDVLLVVSAVAQRLFGLKAFGYGLLMEDLTFATEQEREMRRQSRQPYTRATPSSGTAWPRTT
jgi:hypothetical protein